MRTKHPCVLIHIKIKGEVGAVKHVYVLQYFILTVSRRCSFCGSFLQFMFHGCLCNAVLFVPCSLVATCWGRDLPLGSLGYVVFLFFFCHGSGVVFFIESIPELCRLYFV